MVLALHQLPILNSPQGRKFEMTENQREILDRAIADAVVSAVRDNVSIDANALNLVAANVATAIAAGFAAVSASDEPLAPGS